MTLTLTVRINGGTSDHVGDDSSDIDEDNHDPADDDETCLDGLYANKVVKRTLRLDIRGSNLSLAR